jgi:putative membrane protein insertion efficiency factor
MNALRRMLGAVRRACSRAATAVIVGTVVVYQRTISPLLGRHCRFTPSCSSYFRQAVERYGPIRGSLKGLARIARCHPWSPGGHDPP